MKFREYLEESKEESYTIPWEATNDRNISKYESRYGISIESMKDEANISGPRGNLAKFLTKEMEFDKEDYDMIGF